MDARNPGPVLIQGLGDVGSAIAAVLFRAGYRVALHDVPAPATPRRGMAFADAVFDGSTTLNGLTAKRVETAAELHQALATGATLPVAIRPFADMLRAADWSVVVDARMRKREIPEQQRGIAPLTIGLGPNFVAGGNVDLAIETSWGDNLGVVIAVGPTLPLDGEPRPIGGVARARFVYAPRAGRFDTAMHIGDRVEEGALVAAIADTALRAPISGIIRGLTRDGVDVGIRAKVIEVDPRGDPAAAFGLGERPRRIAEGEFKALTTTFAAEPTT
jgi:xanthine dehydrogenase accessory factor